MTTGAWIAVFFGVVILFKFISHTSRENTRFGMHKKLKEQPGFSMDHYAISSSGQAGIGIDEHAQAICLIGGNWINCEQFSAKDIFASEVFIDGESETRTVRSSQIGGALVGGLLVGGLGAVIGGLSGKQRTSRRVSSVAVRLTVNDMKNPVHDVEFLRHEHARDSIEVRKAVQEARELHARIDMLIRRADQADRQLEQAKAANAPRAIASVSLVDELRKLADLKSSGALDDSEYQDLKGRLIAQAAPALPSTGTIR